MNYRCPICNGCGLVEPTFGGTIPNIIVTSKECPGCNGTGMQYVDESDKRTTIIRRTKMCKNTNPNKLLPIISPYEPIIPKWGH